MFMNFGKLLRDILVLVMVTLIVAGCGGAESRKAKYLERGKNYLSEQNYDKAIVEFKNVLQIDPKYADAYFLFGKAEEGRGNYQQAFGAYSKAIDLNPDHVEAHVQLGRIYLLAGNPAKAKEQADIVLAKQPAYAGALLLKAAVALREDKDEDALKQAFDLIKAAPNEVEAYAIVAAVYYKQKKLDESAAILKQGITANPKDVSLRLNLAQVYTVQGDNKNAEDMLQECITLEPKNPRHRVNLASFLTKTNQLDKAEKVLRDAIAQDPDDDQRRLLLVEFLSTARKDRNAAEQTLLSAIKDISDSSKLRFALASLYVQSGNTPKAMDTYRDMISRYGEKPDGLKARNLLAGLLSAQGKQEESEKLTDEVLKENPNDSDALMAKARSLLVKRDAPGAIAALRTVLRDQPNLVDAYLYLADAHTLNKEPALAKDTLMKAVEQNPNNVKAYLGLAKFYAKTGDFGSAVKTVDQALKLAPTNFDALEAKFELLLAKKDTNGARETLEKIKATYPDNPGSYYQLGQYYMNQRKFEAATREFEQGVSKVKGNYQLMAALVNSYLVQKKPEKAISRLNNELANEPLSRPFANELLGEVYITQKKYDEAETALLKAIAANPTWNVPYRNLATLQRVRGNMASAEQVYQQGLQAIPDDLELLMSMAGAYELNKNYDKAIATYERVLSKQPGNDVAANNLASLLLDHGTGSDSLKRAKELTSRFESSPQPAFLDTLGWVYYRSGELDKAISVMEKVVKQAPAVGIFHYHLGMAYYKKGDNASAKAQLSKALEAKNDFPGIDEARATLKQIQ
jgi:putative PEP-CTERM system TPR-repeat lipoprotein